MFLMFLLPILCSLSTFASGHIKVRVIDIDESENEEETLVFLTSGHVIRFSKHDLPVKNKFAAFKKYQQWINISLDSNQKIEKYAQTLNLQPKTLLPTSSITPGAEYIPSVLESLDLAKTYFHDAKYVSKESQCYNRAHIWTFEWFNKYAINSNKTWLFFTRKYIRKFKFDWWFHVSPSIKVMEDEKIKDKVMDVKYARGPLDLKTWTDIFMKDDANCPMVNTYSEYANYPESGSCYTLRTSMFYYQPVDIENEEVWETPKTNWYKDEIRQAYLEAFDEIN